MGVILVNNATSTLAAGIGTGTTSLTIQAGDASRFPSPGAGQWCPVTVVDLAGNVEVMRCTARSTTTLTVQRAQEGTTARAFAAGSRVDVRLTAAVIAEFLQISGGTLLGHLSVPAGGAGSQVIRANEVSAHAFKLISTLPSTGSDLNDYTAPGLYHQNLTAGATAGENYPTANAGLLIVHESPSNFVYQTYVTYGSDSTIYFRAKYQTNWYPWRTVMDSRGGSFEGGINFGSQWAAAANNLSRHIALYGSTVGINAYNNGMNHVVEDGYTFAWYQGGSRAALISAASHFYSKGNMYVGGVRTSNGPATLGFKTFSSGAYDTASIVATGGTSGDTGSATLSADCSEFQINGKLALTVAGGLELEGGFYAGMQDDGTKSSGTYSPVPGSGNYRKIVNNGAFAFSAPGLASSYDIAVLIENGVSAGAITFTGFDRVDGDDLTTVAGDAFIINVRRMGDRRRAWIEALQ